MKNTIFASKKISLAISIALSGAYSLSAGATGAMLEEIVVEAQKKTETLIQTPISMQALTGDQFQKYANFNFQDIARTTPGLQFNPGVTPDIRLRGISTVTLAAVSLRTNIYQDGALMPRPTAALDAQYDVERFEILKGSQGTLYGKASPTGTINLRTRGPNLSEMDGYVSTSFGQRNAFNTQFGVSLPIIEDVLAIRLAAVYDENQASGVENITTGHKAQNRSSSGRMTVLWQPHDQFTARLTYQYREHKDNPFFTVDGNGYNFDDNELASNVDDINRFRDRLAIAEFTYDINDHLTLTSLTGHELYSNRNLIDSDALPGPIEPVAQPVILPGGSIQDTKARISPYFQQDFRLSSEDNDFWDWQIGLFAERTESVSNVTSQSFTSRTPTVKSASFTLTSIQLKSENYAIYTHNTFHLTDDLNLIAGLRYQETRSTANIPTAGRALTWNNGTLISTPDLTVGNPPSLNKNGVPAHLRKITDHPITGTLKLQYFFDPDLTGYITLDRAYRTGGQNVNIAGNLPTEFAEIGAESADSFEIGTKGNFADRRGRFTLDLFYQRYRNFQQDFQNVPLTDGSLIQSVVLNAKEAVTKGAEFSLSWLWVENFSTNFNLAFADSKFTDYEDALARVDNNCGGVVAAGKRYATCDFSGERLPLASRWSGNLSSDFWMPAFNGTQWYFNTLLNFQSDQVDKVTRKKLGGYSTVDLFTGLRSENDGHWDVSLWAKNIFNRRAIERVYKSGLASTLGSNGRPINSGATSFDQVTTNAPRQVGITGTYRF